MQESIAALVIILCLALACYVGPAKAGHVNLSAGDCATGCYGE